MVNMKTKLSQPQSRNIQFLENGEIKLILRKEPEGCWKFIRGPHFGHAWSNILVLSSSTLDNFTVGHKLIHPNPTFSFFKIKYFYILKRNKYTQRSFKYLNITNKTLGWYAQDPEWDSGEDLKQRFPLRGESDQGRFPVIWCWTSLPLRLEEEIPTFQHLRESASDFTAADSCPSPETFQLPRPSRCRRGGTHLEPFSTTVTQPARPRARSLLFRAAVPSRGRNGSRKAGTRRSDTRRRLDVSPSAARCQTPS